jgi:hypothetical protein
VDAGLNGGDNEICQKALFLVGCVFSQILWLAGLPESLDT